MKLFAYLHRKLVPMVKHILIPEFDREITTDEKLKLFEQLRDELNLKSIADFSKAHGISYNGVQFVKNLRTNIGKTIYIVDL